MESLDDGGEGSCRLLLALFSEYFLVSRGCDRSREVDQEPGDDIPGLGEGGGGEFSF